ncbi:MAG: transcriptional repressor [Melioribacteraceae bacterium]|nr:transcriptional repressor [Melioribacteraceae bacterium]
MISQLSVLKANGYKLTKNRKLVLEKLLENRKPLTLNDIKNLCGEINFATIYRIVNLYLSLGIVNEVKLFDKQTHYELMGNDHHHHIICIKCGKIERLDLCIINKVQQLTDFQITSHIMEFKGICPQCKK